MDSLWPRTRRRSTTELPCHFCGATNALRATAVPPRPRPGSTSTGTPGFTYQCATCECWNGWDEHGETLSDHAQMHDASLNTASFERRGTQPETSFPSVSTVKSPFCSSCSTNHTLVLNLLANYLPDEADPSYLKLMAHLPEYKASLLSRYPPVCAKCEPIAEEIIRKGDYRAKTSALNGFLRRANPTAAVAASGSSTAPMKIRRPPGLLILWEIRRVLWDVSGSLSIMVLAQFALDGPTWLLRWIPPYFLSAFTLLSILWIAFDPDWKDPPPPTLQTARTRRLYIRDMLFLYFVRLISACVVDLTREHWLGLPPRPSQSVLQYGWFYFHFLVEVIIFCHIYYLAGTPTQPRPIRLTRTSSLTSRLTPPSPLPKASTVLLPTQPYSFTQPPLPPPPPTNHPLFGTPSFPAYIPPRSASDGDDTAMDWTPAAPPRPNPFAKENHLADGVDGEEEGEDETWKGFNKAPRVFGPSGGGRAEGTGLEGLLEGWVLADEARTGGLSATANGSGSSQGGGASWLGWLGKKEEK